MIRYINKKKMIKIDEIPKQKSKPTGKKQSLDQYTYLRRIIDVYWWTYVKSRINKARHSYAVFKTIWKSRKISLGTKMKLFNINLKSAVQVPENYIGNNKKHLRVYPQVSWKHFANKIEKSKNVKFWHRCIHLPVIHPWIHPRIHVSTLLCIHLYKLLSIHPCIHLSTFLFIHPCIHESTLQPIHLCIQESTVLSIHT